MQTDRRIVDSSRGVAIAWGLVFLYDSIIFGLTWLGVRRLRCRNEEGVRVISGMNSLAELILRDGKLNMQCYSRR